jgi:hypothetical protein
VDIYFVNESTKFSDQEAWQAAWACDYQARYHFGRSGWRSDVRCSFLPGGAKAKIPAGSAVMHLLDTADVQGALGYHDEDGNEIPYGRVFVVTSQQNGDAVSEVCSHEVLELAADKNVNFTALDKAGTKLYAVEVGDPVQGNGYDVGAPEGKTTGIVVADFATPAYFDPNTTTEKVDFRGALKAPFTIGPQGYMAYIDLTNLSAGWQQTFGAERKGPVVDPDDLSRIGRRQKQVALP